MKHLIGLFWLVIALLAVMLTSCTDIDGDYSVSANDKLIFSVDTLYMDTVITGTGTSTRTFSVYNSNAKDLRIMQIALSGGSDTEYRVNVDGTFINNGIGQPIDLRSKDSLTVFVEMTARPSDANTPIHRNENMIFTLESGIQQSVVLDAFGQDVITLNNPTISSDSVLHAQRPYLIYGNMTVSAGARLTLRPGVTLLFHNGSGLDVQGTLIAEGTLSAPIVFRGDRLDNMFENQPYDRIAGQWNGIYFATTSYGNHLNYCDIHSTLTAIRCDSSDVSQEKIRVENSIIHNAQGDCLELKNCNTFFGNTQISNAMENCITLIGGTGTFIHCTIANFYPFTGGRGSALTFMNEQNGIPYPLLQASFRNCVITGYDDDEIYGLRSTDQSIPFNYSFSNSLLKTTPTDDENMKNIAWDESTNPVYGEKNFRPFDLTRLIFSFELDSLSTARDIGDITVTGNYYPNDRKGKARLVDGTSDAGCYEFSE